MAGPRSDCHHDCHWAEQNADAKETSASVNKEWSGSPARHSHLPDFRTLCLVYPAYVELLLGLLTGAKMRAGDTPA
jgi:hypothetical protein